MFLQHAIAFVFLAAGSISDLKTREVSDFANYGLITLGVAFNAYLSISLGDWKILAGSLAMFGIFWLFGYMMYRSGQWGGGDSKMLMGLGALYGFSAILFSFLLFSLLMGAVYGLLWSLGLALANRSAFMARFKILLHGIQRWRILALSTLFITAIFAVWLRSNFWIILFSLAALGYCLFYLSVFIRAVEDSCMRKWISPEKLTEGDWLAQNVVVAGKTIAGPNDKEGLSKKQLSKLRVFAASGKVKTVLVKEGIPFIPSFLLGWIVALGIHPSLLFQLFQ